jgi:hypothetical protein
MSRARRLFVTALAVVSLIVTAAPAAPGPNLDEYTWEPMFGSSTVPIANDEVFALKVVGDDLYVGGSFTDFAGIAAADRIARWSGADQEWQALEVNGAADGSITAGSVKSIEVSGANVYVGGDFTFTDFYLDTHSNLAIFASDREKWYGFNGEGGTDAVNNGEVRAIYADEVDGVLYVGGSFTDGGDDPNADYLMIGSYSACVGVVGACVTEFPVATVCGGVHIACAPLDVPNVWIAAGDNGAGGPALGSFVSSISAHPDGGVIVAGNFGAAGGVAGANSIAHFEGPYGSPQVWNAQNGVPSVTMYSTRNAEGELFVAGWEGVYQRTADTTWVERCASTLHIGGNQWTSIAVSSSELLFVGSGSHGAYACDPRTDGATQVFGSGSISALAMYDGALIAAGGIDIAGLPTADFIARYSEPLPATDNDSRQATDLMILITSLAAFTALAGTQLLRRA